MSTVDLNFKRLCFTNAPNMKTFPIPNTHVDYGQNVLYPPLPPLSMPPPPICPPQFIPFSTQLLPWGQKPPQCYTAWQDCYSSPVDRNIQTTIKYQTMPTADIEDQKWVQSWLNQIRKSDVIGKKHYTSDVKIYKIKGLLSDAIRIIKELKNAFLILKVMIKSVSNIEWEKKCQEIDGKKEELCQLLKTLKTDPTYVIGVMEKLKKRKTKRDRLKRQNLKRKAEKKISNENCEKQLQYIDAWLEEMKEDVERNRRDEELRREADDVLWNVTHKKAEAQRHISLLSSLLQLRNAKIIALRSAKTYISESEVVTFNTIIEKLKVMWERQLAGYLLEERGLRVMLIKEKDSEKKHDIHMKQILLDWEMAIFGTKCNDPAGEPQDMDKFLEVRRAWDHFVTSEKTMMASTLSLGWVLPSPPSDKEWNKCLKLVK